MAAAKGPAPYLPPSSSGTPGGSREGSYGKSGGASLQVMGKGRKAENLGNLTSMRGAGLTTIGGGDPMAHSVNQYGKGGLPVVGGGNAPYVQQSEPVS